jgi:hypothetical protein
MCLFLLMSACAGVPGVRAIDEFDSQLYVVTAEGTVKIYDLSRRDWPRTIRLPERISYWPGDAHIVKVLKDDDSLLIQTSPNNFTAESNVYRLRGKVFHKVGTLPVAALLLGVDHHHIYAARIVYSKAHVREKDFSARPLRYDKEMRNSRDNHFKQFPDLVVSDVWYSQGRWWYVAVESPAGVNPPLLRGTIVLLSQADQAGTVERFPLEGHEIFLQGSAGLVSRDQIWISSGLFEGLLRYSTTDRTAEIIKLKTQGVSLWGCRPFPETNRTGETRFFWFLCGGALVRFDSQMYEFLRVDVPTPRDASLDRASGPLLSNPQDLWIVVSLPIKGSGGVADHLMRVSKNDLQVELIPVDPVGKMLGAAAVAIVSAWPMYLVISIGSLVFVMVGCLFRLSMFRDLRARGMTGWCSLGALITLVGSTAMERIFPLLNLAALLIIALAAVLVSRAFTFSTKGVRSSVLSWTLVILFGLASTAVCLMLVFVYFRDVTGEASWGIAVLGLSAGGVVGVISLIVNVVEKVSWERRVSVE